MVPATAAPSARLDPRVLLWLLVALALATMNLPGDLWDTVRHLRMPDTDDAMRLVEAGDLANGQGWFDNVQRRFLPPAGVPSHWSRLLDAPIAALILGLTPLVGRQLAEGWAALVWPSLLLGLLCVVLYRGTRARFGGRAAILAVLAATQTSGIKIQFQVGRVDHHNVQILAILGLVFCAARGGLRAGFAAGALAAVSVAIGLEGLPYVVLGGVVVAADWVLRGRPALPTFVGFGAGLGLVAPALFGLQTAPSLWAAPACDALSPPWLILAGGGLGTALVCASLDGRMSGWPSRLGLAALCGGGVVGVFALAYPACLAGPFTGMTPLVRDHWLRTVQEMTPLATFIARRQWEWLLFYPTALLASFAATWLAWQGPQRRLWSVAAPMLWTGLVLGLFQFRGLYVVSGLVPLVAGVVIDRAFRLAPDQAVPAWRRFGGAALAAGLVSSVWSGPTVLAETLLPASDTADTSGAVVCRAEAAVQPLAALPPGTVLAPIFMGPSILLRTPHAIVGAPYHRAIAGIAAALEAFGGQEDALRRSVDETGARYVVACPGRPGDDLGPETAFATRLARGETTAAWLEPLAVPGGLKVWRVVR